MSRMTNKQFEKTYYPKYESVIRAIARKLARSDSDLVDDLFQEGCIALLDLDLTKASRNEDAWVRQAIKFRMIDFLRRLRPAAYKSLDEQLHEGGNQLTTDVNDEPTLVKPQYSRKYRPVMAEDDRARRLLERYAEGEHAAPHEDGEGDG